MYSDDSANSQNLRSFGSNSPECYDFSREFSLFQDEYDEEAESYKA